MQQEKDLDLLRDEKCTPIAQAVMKEMAPILVNEQEDYKGITLKTLSLMLESDLNVDSEVSYISQLILSGLKGLNVTLQGCEITANDDARYNIIAGKILTILADSNVRLNISTPDEIAIDFAPVKDQLNTLFAEEKLTQMEVKYITDKIFNSFTSFNNLLARNIELSTEKMECKILGIENMSDLTLKKVHETLLS